MLPKIQRILYATDLSNNSRQAFGYAAGLAERYDARMTVVHVVEPINPNAYMQISSMMGEAEWLNLQAARDGEISEDIMSRLKHFCRDLQADMADFRLGDDQLLVRKGFPVDEIIRLAASEDMDLIVMGTHGYGLVKDALMGGTVRRLLRQSEKPVLVVPNPEKEKD